MQGQSDFLHPLWPMKMRASICPALLEKCGVDAAGALKVLDALEVIVQPLEVDLYADFFGTGVATWTTDRIEVYFTA